MRTLPRLAAVAALALVPVLGAAAPASACTDDGGRCLVSCVQSVVTTGTCRL